MKKKVIIALIAVGVVACAYVTTYTIRTAQLDKETGKEMTKELVDEFDSFEITEFEGTLKDDTETVFTKVEDMKELSAGTVVKCKIKLASGEKIETDGYITKGDQNNMSYDGNTVKITIAEEKETKETTEEK